MAESIEEEIRRLQAEAAGKPHKMPGMASLAWNHPGVLAYQIKTPEHYQRDMQQSDYLDGIAKVRDRDPVAFGEKYSPEAMEAVDRRQELATPYWNRGVLAYGQPLRNGLDVMQAYGSNFINAGRMLAGVEGAGDDMADSADRMLLGIPSALSGVPSPHRDAWEAERQQAGDKSLNDRSFVKEKPMSRGRVFPTQESLPMDKYASQGLTDGQTAAEDMGSTGLPSRVLGMGLDIVTDPVGGMGNGIRALAKGAFGTAAKHIGMEAALPTASLGYLEYMRNEARKKAEQDAQYR